MSLTQTDTEVSIEDNENNTDCDLESGYYENEWTQEIENLLIRWRDEVKTLSEIHLTSGYINKYRYYRIAIPSTLLPFIMTFISQVVHNRNTLLDYTKNIDDVGNINGTITSVNGPTNIIDGVAFMVTSILSALNLFFNYNKLSEEHFQTSARYNDIVNRIDSEIARLPKFRTPPDVIVTELKCLIESLTHNSPELPGNWC